MKRFFALFLVVLLVLTQPLVCNAENGDQDVTITYNDTQVYVDRKRVDILDSNGNRFEPFLLNGTVYVPYEMLSKASDKPVIWDKKAKSIFVGVQDRDTPTALLTNLDIFNYQHQNAELVEWSSENADATGVNYSSAILGSINTYYSDANLYTEYLLNQKYTRLAGTYFLEYGSRFCSSVIVMSIYGDGELLRRYDMTAGTIPIYFDDVDVTGVVKLRIEFAMKERHGDGGFKVALGQPGLY